MKELDSNTFAGRWQRIAASIPDEIAIRQGSRTLTWREWDRRSTRLARALLGLGIGRQDKIAIMEYNSCEYMEAMYAAFKIAACPVNVNYRYYDEELFYVIDNSDASVVVLNAEFASRLGRIRHRLDKVRHFIVVDGYAPNGMLSYEDLLSAESAGPLEYPWAGPGDDDILFLYTGGTTGLPKGVMWRQEDCVLGMIDVLVQGISDNTKRIADAPVLITGSRLWDNRLNRWLLKRDLVERFSAGALRALFNRPNLSSRLVRGRLKCIVCAPLMHGTAVVGAFTVLMLGGSIVLLEGKRFRASELWETVERIGREAERTEVLGILIVGDAFALPMVEELQRARYDTSAVNLVFSSGVLWSPELKKSLLEHMPQAILQNVLGATEGLTTGYATTAAHKEIPRATFRVNPEGRVPVRVIDEETGLDVAPGSGDVGVMAVGGHVPVGYWKDPEKTEKVFRTIGGRRYNVFGDMCTVDSEGFIQFLGRGSECINTGGEKVFASEVEETVADHPAVADVAVVGIPHPRWGQAVTAVVVLHDGRGDATGEDIIAFCRGRIADYKIPKHVVFSHSLERMPSGKKEYKRILEIALEHAGARDAEKELKWISS